MTDVFTGLVPETAEQRASRKSREITLPPMAGEVKEKLYDIPLPFVKSEDQRQTNSCSGHGGSTAGEAVSFLETGQLIQLSRWGLYVLAQKKCGLFGSDCGATLSGVEEAMREGIPEEESWKFPGWYDTAVPPGAMESAKKRKVVHTIDLESGGYDSVRTVIGQNIGACVFACSWPLVVTGGNRIERYQPQGRGGHCMAWVALSKITDSKGRPYIIGPNSHANLPYLIWSPDAVQAVLDHEQWGSFGITMMQVPKPREVDWAGADNPFLK